MVRVQLLGPVEAYAGDRRIELGGAKPRALFAALVLARGRVVPAERLIDVIWPQDPPDRARSLLQTYVSTLRASFGAQGIGGIIETRSPGYVAALEDVEVDVDVFARLLDEARARMAAAEPAAAGELLEQAIGLWRGAALSGLDQSPLTGEARALDELLTTAIEERGDVALRLGRSGLVAELTGLVARHPLNERLRGQLMTALYRVGRQADALACYRQGRDVLVEELGLEPGQELAAIHNAILRGDEDLRVAAVEPERPAPRVVPAQVPAAPADFTGRQAEV
ncbi:MAG: AfsR/SARP family transcriptional regulator, partial [Hamadaea sp.]|nr:AfsR/SARP family transcriptional regulator [Hamadaea sp.]